MIESVRRFINTLLAQTRRVFDISVDATDKIVKKIGPQGYYFYGISSNTFFFFASLVIKLFPQVDWAICLIIRGLVTFISSQIIAYTYNKPLIYDGSEFMYVTIRNFLISIQQLFFYYVLLVIPLNITWIINNTGPLFVFVIGYFLLGTILTKRDIFFLMISVLGVNIITAPQLVLKVVSIIIPVNQEDLQSDMDSYQMLISLLWFGSLGLWGLAIVIVKLCKTATSLSINNNLGIQLIIFGTIAYIIRSDNVQIPSISDLLFVVLFLGIPTFISQILFIHGALVAEDQGKFTLTNYIPVFYSYLYQIIFLGRNPKLLELGGVIISFYGLYQVVVKPKSKNDKNQIRLSMITDKDIDLHEQEELHKHLIDHSTFELKDIKNEKDIENRDSSSTKQDG